MGAIADRAKAGCRRRQVAIAGECAQHIHSKMRGDPGEAERQVAPLNAAALETTVGDEG